MLPLLLLAIAPAAAGDVGWLEAPLFAPPLANPSSPELSLGLHLDNPDYLDARVGARFGLVRYDVDDEVSVQLGLEGGAWVRLHVEEAMVFALRTADYLLGIPLMARWGAFDAELVFAHISAHLGDGFAYDGTVITDRLRRVPLNYSRELIRAQLAWRTTLAPVDLRLYGGGGLLVQVRPIGTAPGFAAAGGEAVWRLSDFVAPYGAFEIAYNADAASLDLSGQLGAYVGPPHHDRHVRLAVSGYSGSDRRGQFLGSTSRFLALLLAVRL